ALQGAAVVGAAVREHRGHAGEEAADGAAAAVGDAGGDAARAGGRLVLCRDHLGVKPLYYTRSPVSGALRFGSEIKALLQDPSVVARPDEQVVFEYLEHGLLDHRAETFFEGVYRVPAASTVVFELGGEAAGGGAGGRLPAAAYWQPRPATDGSPDPALFRRVLRDAVERSLAGEEPAGVVLGDDVDSAAVAALAAELLQQRSPAAVPGSRLRVFSAVAEGDPGGERPRIDDVAQGLGAEATTAAPTSAQLFDDLRDLVWHQDEPTATTDAYLRWCLARDARGEVAALLDGLGGEELLAGPAEHHVTYLWQLRREGGRAALRHEAAAARDVLAPQVRRHVVRGRRRLSIAGTLRPTFRARVSDPGDARSRDDLKRRLLDDLLAYRLPALLRGADRSAMAFSVESRLPYLDREVVEYALALPPDALVRDGWTQWILREGIRGSLPEKVRRRRAAAPGALAPGLRWVKARRAQLTGVLQSPSFAARPYWDAERVVDAFRRFCEGKTQDSWSFWRAVDLELWLREFCDRPAVLEGVDEAAALSAPVRGEAASRGAVPARGDELAPALVGGAGGPVAEQLLAAHAPNATKHLFACVRGRVYARLPVKTDLVGRGDDLEALFRRQVLPHVRPGDLVAIAEKPVATSQGRSWALDEIHPGRLARVLSKAVTRTPHGIGLGIPETMQLAIDEAGAPRILAATAAAAAGRLVRRRGWFYAIAGPSVEAIDGPTPYTLPPHNTHAKLGPAEPDAVAERLARTLREGLGADLGDAAVPAGAAASAAGPQATDRSSPAGPSTAGAAVHVAVVDVSDLDARVLGASTGTDRALVHRLMLDNPLGQGHEQTPVCVLRDLGPLSPPA
ncbi:MAG: asparagine synthase-related protein, partial [Thermoleophilia bacterium]|nr:asparagine synthase-related protein [Thermoleophilia bacterium]